MGGLKYKWKWRTQALEWGNSAGEIAIAAEGVNGQRASCFIVTAVEDHAGPRGEPPNRDRYLHPPSDLAVGEAIMACRLGVQSRGRARAEEGGR